MIMCFFSVNTSSPKLYGTDENIEEVGGEATSVETTSFEIIDDEVILVFCIISMNVWKYLDGYTLEVLFLA